MNKHCVNGDISKICKHQNHDDVFEYTKILGGSMMPYSDIVAR